MREMTDMEKCLLYSQHLYQPCSVVVDGKRHDIRPFYEKLAKEALSNMTNPGFKAYLERAIKGDILKRPAI